MASKPVVRCELQGSDDTTPVSPVVQDSSHRPIRDEKPVFHISSSPVGPLEPYTLSLSGGETIPYTINRYLRDYQRDGARFIYTNFVQHRGCVLGDDMGLGKTIQVIAFLAAVLHKTGTWEDVKSNLPEFLQSQSSTRRLRISKMFLVVAPLSVLYNWKDELDTWGHFRSLVIHGTRREEEFGRVKRGRCEIALTTYETLRLCVDQFNSIEWSAVIVDEAHKVKNPNSQITQAMKKMRCKVRIGLTGTILQNNLEEMWCVMDWANPGCLGTLEEFRSRYADPIERGQKHSATKRELATGREAVRSLAIRISQWFLRRTKALISSQLPRKDDRVVFCSLTNFQQAVYRAVLDSEDVTLLLRSGEPCNCGSKRSRRRCCFKKNSKGVPVKDLYFSYLAILRKVANHVALLQTKEGTSKKQVEYVSEICQKVFQKVPDFVQRCQEAAFEAMSDPVYSGKMKVLQQLLKHYIQNGDKVLLFSLSTKLLDVLESYCMASGMEYRRLDGRTKCRDRLKIVKEFNSTTDINICLVSTTAGGLGLNFVGANIVVLFDPTWNPASDLQAIDRAYRIGQCRDVTVLRLVSLGTVEEIIYLRQVYKQQLQCAVVGNEHARRYFEAVQGTDGRPGELFGIRNLFRMQTDGACLTKQILEREGRLEAGTLTACTPVGEVKLRESPPFALITALHTLGFLSMSYKRSSPEMVFPQSGRRSHSFDAFSENLPMEMVNKDNTVNETSEVSHSGKAERVLDFSSGSEDEDARCKVTGGARESRPSGASHAPLTLFQHGFAGLLQGHHSHYHTNSVEEETSSHSDHILDNKPNTCEDGAGESRTAQKPHKRVNIREGRRDSSPDADIAVKKVKSDVRNGEQCDARDGGVGVGFTCLKDRNCKDVSPDEDLMVGTLDQLLGGVKEVLYTHSNQRVVGSSKAEAHISSAALRDVFQYGINTQAPANQLLDCTEILSADTDQSTSTPAGNSRLHHPVTQTVKRVHRTRNATVIVGDTPISVRRKQLEEMAAFFNADSVKDFANDILRSTSDFRKAKLKEFYSKDSALKVIVGKVFSDPVVTVSKSPKKRNHLRIQPETSSGGRRSILRFGFDSPPNVEAVVEEESLKDKGRSSSLQSRENVKNACEVASFIHDSRPDGVSGALALNKTKLNTPLNGESGDGSRVSRDGKPKNDCKETAAIRVVATSPQRGGFSPLKQTSNAKEGSNYFNCNATTIQERVDPHKSYKQTMTDLIGDISVLDDLFKCKERNINQSSAAVHSQRAKSRHKDVWDILSEGDEEHINKLTDLSQVEKICSSAKVISKTKRIDTTDSTGLWRKNEKFLWKR